MFGTYADFTPTATATKDKTFCFLSLSQSQKPSHRKWTEERDILFTVCPQFLQSSFESATTDSTLQFWLAERKSWKFSNTWKAQRKWQDTNRKTQNYLKYARAVKKNTRFLSLSLLVRTSENLERQRTNYSTTSHCGSQVWLFNPAKMSSNSPRFWKNIVRQSERLAHSPQAIAIVG